MIDHIFADDVRVDYFSWFHCSWIWRTKPYCYSLVVWAKYVAPNLTYCKIFENVMGGAIWCERVSEMWKAPKKRRFQFRGIAVSAYTMNIWYTQFNCKIILYIGMKCACIEGVGNGINVRTWLSPFWFRTSWGSLHIPRWECSVTFR